MWLKNKPSDCCSFRENCPDTLGMFDRGSHERFSETVRFLGTVTAVCIRVFHLNQAGNAIGMSKTAHRFL